MAFLADRLKPQSIKVYLAGVRALHISHGHHNPLTHTIKLQQTLRGIEREHSAPVKQKLPITFDLRCRLHYLIDPHSEDDIVYWVAMATAHFLLLRAGEFIVQSNTSYDAETLLRVQDATLHNTATGAEYNSSPPPYIEDRSTTTWCGSICWSCSSHCLCRLRPKSQSSPSSHSSLLHSQRSIVPTLLQIPISTPRSYQFSLN